jgi:hypothetical protein
MKKVVRLLLKTSKNFYGKNNKSILNFANLNGAKAKGRILIFEAPCVGNPISYLLILPSSR